MRLKMPRNGRGWAYIGSALGGGVSIAANIAHSFVPPKNWPKAEEWHPSPLAVVVSVFWPVALFVAVEILARTAWPVGWRWKLARFGGLLPVALVAALVSYRHLSGLLDIWGEDDLGTALGPLAVDGLMVMASAALLATGKQTREPESVPVAVPVDVPAVPVAVPEPRKIKPASVEPADSNERAEIEPASDSRQETPEELAAQREAARELYRASVEAGTPLSGAEVARRFGRAPRWGVDRVNEVRRAMAQPEPAKTNGHVQEALAVPVMTGVMRSDEG